MKRWQKTTVEWNCGLGLETNIPISDWPNAEEKHFHKIHVIKATALPDRKGEIELSIKRLVVSPTTEKNNIYTSLSEGLWSRRKKLFRLNGNDDHISVKDKEDYFNGVYIIEFRLDNGDQFCDIVIGIVRATFEIFGVKDGDGYRLADFSVKQETYIQLEDAWITFARWLRIKHRLPIFCSADL